MSFFCTVIQGGTLFIFTPYGAGDNEIAQIGDALDNQFLLVLFLNSTISADAAMMLGSTISQAMRNSVLHKAGITLPLKPYHIKNLNDRLSAAYLKGLSLLYNRKMRSDEFCSYNLLWLYRTVGRTSTLNRKLEHNCKIRAHNWIRREMGMKFDKDAINAPVDDIRESEKTAQSRKSAKEDNTPIVMEPTGTSSKMNESLPKQTESIDVQGDYESTHCCFCWPSEQKGAKPLPRLKSRERIVSKIAVPPSETKEANNDWHPSLIQPSGRSDIVFSVLKLELLSARHVPQSRSALEQEAETTFERVLLRRIEQMRMNRVNSNNFDEKSVAALRKIGMGQEFNMIVTESDLVRSIRERSAAVSSVSHTSQFSSDLEAFGSSSKASSVNSSPSGRKYNQVSVVNNSSWKHQQKGPQQLANGSVALGGWAQMARMMPLNVENDSHVISSSRQRVDLHIVTFNDVVLVYAPRPSSYTATQTEFGAAIARAGSLDDQSVESSKNNLSNSVCSIQYLTDLTLWSKTCIEYVRPMMSKMREDGASFLDLGWIQEF